MLGTTPGVSRTYFPSVADGLSQAVHIPGGFPFGQSNQTIVYVRQTIVAHDPVQAIKSFVLLLVGFN